MNNSIQKLHIGTANRRLLFPSSLIVALLISLFVVVITWKEIPYLSNDSRYYINLAEGNIREIPKPFSTRILHPIMVQVLVKVSGLNTDQSFLTWGILSLVVLCLAVSQIIRLANIPNPYILSVVALASPLLLSMFRDYYLPDLFYASLLGLFFLFTFEHAESQKMYRWASLLVLFLLFLTRESTILLVLSLVLISIYKASERKFALSAIAIALIGILVHSLVGRLGQANIHAINELLYLGLKIPFNFLKNIFGVQLWTNTFAAQTIDTCKPLVQMNLPVWLSLGSVRNLGVCPFEPAYPLKTIKFLLTTFGVAPTIVLFFLGKDFKRILRNSPFWLTVALTYGLISFFIGTSVGASVERLIGYGWPCFWIAAPVLLFEYFHIGQKSTNKLLVFYLIACWTPWLVNNLNYKSSQSTIFVIFVALVMHYFSFRTIHQSMEGV